MSVKAPADVARDALTRFTTAMAANRGVEPLVSIVTMWTMCSVQLRQSGYSARDMADLLVEFQKSYRIKTTN